MDVTLCLVLVQTASHLLQERPHHGSPDVVVGEEEVQQDVVHLAVVGATEALPQEVHSLLVFSLGGVIEHQRPLQWMELHQSGVSGGRDCTGWPAAVSVSLDPCSVGLDGFKIVSQFPDKLLQAREKVALALPHQGRDELLLGLLVSGGRGED